MTIIPIAGTSAGSMLPVRTLPLRGWHGALRRTHEGRPLESRAPYIPRREAYAREARIGVRTSLGSALTEEQLEQLQSPNIELRRRDLVSPMLVGVTALLLIVTFMSIMTGYGQLRTQYIDTLELTNMGELEGSHYQTLQEYMVRNSWRSEFYCAKSVWIARFLVPGTHNQTRRCSQTKYSPVVRHQVERSVEWFGILFWPGDLSTGGFT